MHIGWGLCDRVCLVLVCRGRYCFFGGVLLFILGSSLGGVGPVRGLRGGGRRGWCDVTRSRPGAAKTILLFHIISARPSKQTRMVGSTLGVYNFGLIFVSACLVPTGSRGSAKTCSSHCALSPATLAVCSAYSRLAAQSAIRSGTRSAKWAGGSRSLTHRRAAMCGFTQDDDYVRGVAPTHKCSSGSFLNF